MRFLTALLVAVHVVLGMGFFILFGIPSAAIVFFRESWHGTIMDTTLDFLEWAFKSGDWP